MDTRYVVALITFYLIIGYVHALPSVLNKNRRNLPSSNTQTHYNITSSSYSSLPSISEESYVDFENVPPTKNPSGRPNICRDCVCGISNRKMRIVGGNVTEIHEFPWIATMSRRGKFYCAGSLITRKHLLTAAHCLEGFNTKEIQIVLGDHDRSIKESSTIQRRIKAVHIHENFDTYTFNNDIAVIELDSPVTFNGIIRPACLPENRDIDYSGAMAVAAGWGHTGEREPISQELRKVSLPILSDEECRTAGYDKKRLTDNMFCAGYLEGKRDACQGDSGGPLHISGTYNHLEVVGIISWGRGCARPQFPGVYTKLTNYLGWLKNHLNGECVCPPPTSKIAGRMTQFLVTPKILALLTFGLLMQADGFLVNFDTRSSEGPLNFFQTDSNRSRRFLFDELFGIDITGSADTDDGKLRNCTCECGIINQENRIIGGRPTGPNRYPWVARLVYDGQFHCGASLVTNDYVLTAAHCVRRLKRSKIRVVLGDYDQYVNTDGVAVMRAVSSVIRHRNFDTNSYNHDVALLKLRKPVKFTKTIKPVCLPQYGTDPAGKEGTVVGWGRTTEGGVLPGVVHEVQVPILSLSQCRQMKYRASRITNNMICAGRGAQDSCQGDSGGPLLVQEGDKLEIAGIVSWGVGCGRPGYPGVYTRVARYLNWIRTNMKDTCLCVK
ncbi:transmembrane protease serine 9 [Cephus cinctus]|uniref:limulus clotting factor C n=1 Tax=Cephus cinctus TaxID=211228 RepID=A0AAJ7RRU6_CEPCN|nr:transmembrane protease serine 9 [Cephus cinctus]